MVTLARVAPPTLGAATLRDFQDTLRGTLLQPEDDEYEAARHVWNGRIDSRPALIVRCATADDVAAAVRFGRSHGLEIAVRGGGHSGVGHSTCDGGLVVDLSAMKRIAVDPGRRRARVAPGVLLGELDAATQEFGLAVPAGQISHTGVAGLTLGGGIGWLMRKHGLTIDNLIEVEIVTADGRLLTASEAEHPDLFWGVRGGGGNFGIVTSFEFQLHPVGPLVLGGPVIFTLDKATEVLRGYREFLANAPDELTPSAVLMTVPPMAPFPETLWGRHAVAIDVCYAGPLVDGERAVAPIRTFAEPDLDLIGPMPYVVRQRMLDETAPHGLHYHQKAHLLRDLSDAAIEAMVVAYRAAPGPRTHVVLSGLGGAVGRVAPDATAFPHRNAGIVAWIIGAWRPEEAPEAHVAWNRAVAASLEPDAVGVYVNSLGAEGEERVRAAYGANYQRLVALKRRYDPTNLFRRNQNIPPAP